MYLVNQIVILDVREVFEGYGTSIQQAESDLFVTRLDKVSDLQTVQKVKHSSCAFRACADDYLLGWDTDEGTVFRDHPPK